MEVLLEVTVLYALVLFLSFIVERALEMLKAIYDLLDSKLDLYHFWSRKARRLADKLENRLQVYEYVSPRQLIPVVLRFEAMLLNKEEQHEGSSLIISGDLVRALYIRIASQLLGILMGIGFACWLHIDLIQVFYQAAGEQRKWFLVITSPTVRQVLTGIIIGLGSGPVHFIVTFLERRQKKTAIKGATP